MYDLYQDSVAVAGHSLKFQEINYQNMASCNFSVKSLKCLLLLKRWVSNCLHACDLFAILTHRDTFVNLKGLFLISGS